MYYKPENFYNITINFMFMETIGNYPLVGFLLVSHFIVIVICYVNLKEKNNEGSIVF